jgi:hypothetical protein
VSDVYVTEGNGLITDSHAISSGCVSGHFNLGEDQAM